MGMVTMINVWLYSCCIIFKQIIIELKWNRQLCVICIAIEKGIVVLYHLTEGKRAHQKQQWDKNGSLGNAPNK